MIFIVFTLLLSTTASSSDSKTCAAHAPSYTHFSKQTPEDFHWCLQDVYTAKRLVKSLGQEPTDAANSWPV